LQLTGKRRDINRKYLSRTSKQRKFCRQAWCNERK